MKAPEDRWPSATALRDALLFDRGAPAWRSEHRDPVRYTSPRPDGPRAELRTVSPRRGSAAAEPRANTPAATRLPNGIVLEPEHLASLTPAQREDLRLWHGRVHLLDRIKAMRGYTVLTIAATVLAMVGVGVAVDEGAFPLILCRSYRCTWG